MDFTSQCKLRIEIRSEIDVTALLLASFCQNAENDKMIKTSLGDEGWNQLTASSISMFSTDLKRIKLSTFYSAISEQIKHLQSVGQLLRFQSNSDFRWL